MKNNPQEMTPLEMRAFMQQANSGINQLQFRNADGVVIFTAIYVDGIGECQEVIAAVEAVEESWETSRKEDIVPL